MRSIVIITQLTSNVNDKFFGNYGGFNMQLGERIKALRQKRGLTQVQLCRIIGVSNVSLQHWESGSRAPSIAAVIELSKAFGVTVDYLLGVDIRQDVKDATLLTQEESALLDNYRVLDSHGRTIVNTICQLERARIDSEPKRKEKIVRLHNQTPSRYIPRYLTPSAAGYSVPLDGDEFEMILVDDTVPQDADFAVRIQGNSMMPYISDGETVYVKKTRELLVGDVGIFAVDGAMYCKLYYIDKEGNTVLVSANPECIDSNVIIHKDSSSTVECFGKVILKTKIDLPSYLFN